MAQTTTRSSGSTSDIVRQIVVLAAVIATIVFNGLSQTLPIGGKTSAQVSNTYNTYFTPANYAFAIWGVIYLLLMVYGVYQALPSQRTNPNTKKIAVPFLITCVANCVWITLFQYEQLALSVIVIAIFLLALIAIYVQLNIGRANVSMTERLALHLPFSVYLGWVSVATIANVSLFGVSQQWGDLFGIAQPTWAAIMLVVASVIGVIMAVTRRDIAYIAVFAWAFTAIVNKQAAYPVVTTTALLMVAILVIMLVGSIVAHNRNTQTLATGRA